jgi:PadR family transcriptional regulator PadR
MCCLFSHNPNKLRHRDYNLGCKGNVEEMAQVHKREIVQRIFRNLLDVQVLRLLAVEPMWGYRIKKVAEAKFEVTLRHGALYPLLGMLEKKGFVTSQEERQGRRTRKVYAVTKRGREYVEAYESVLREQLSGKDTK